MDNVNITASNTIDNVVIEITPNVTIVEVTSGGGGDDSNYAKLDEANTFTGNPQDIVGGSLRIKDGFVDTNRGIEYFERDIDPTLGFPTVVPNFRHTIYADESKIRFERTGGTTGEPVLSVFDVDHITRVLDFKKTPTINGVPIGSGGGGSQNLNQVLSEGNATDGENIFISDGDEITFDNSSRIRKGLTDAGNGGAKGIALVCSADYELKWEAGRQYVMQQDGFTIREVSHNFTITPTATDDDTKGFTIDSRWLLDNGNVYLCIDATEGNAVWELQANGGAVDSVNGYTGNVSLVTGDVLEGDGTILGRPSQLYFTTARVLATLLTGLSIPSASAIAATDSLLTSFGKLQAQLNAKQNKNLNFGTKTGSFTLALADTQDIIEVDSLTDVVLTVPSNASVAFDIGYRIRGFQLNTGSVTITPSGGVTVLSPNNRSKTSFRYSQFELIKKGTDTWILSGDII